LANKIDNVYEPALKTNADSFKIILRRLRRFGSLVYIVLFYCLPSDRVRNVYVNVKLLSRVG